MTNPSVHRIAIILAGGGSRRMGGVDKGDMMLHQKSLFDHVHARLRDQSRHIYISGRNGYGSNLDVIPDLKTGPSGPAAGLWAAVHRLKQTSPEARCFFTAPIDGPFVPLTLFDQLDQAGPNAIAKDKTGAAATFAKWTIADLQPVLANVAPGKGIALQQIAAHCAAATVMVKDAYGLMNINTAEDLHKAAAFCGE